MSGRTDPRVLAGTARPRRAEFPATMKNPAHLLLAALASFGLNPRVSADEDFQKLDAPARLALARERHEAAARELCTKAGLTYPPRAIFLRAFKHPGALELWAADGDTPLRLLKTYAVLARSGTPGPKRRQGDLQVPEGCYHLAVFNPLSRFHLSLGLDYPNAADRLHADPEKPGGEIYIHGGDRSIGCLPLGDEAIEELYLLALDTRDHGQPEIPIHLFPAAMRGEAWEEMAHTHPEHAAFWAELHPIHDAFEQTRRIPPVEISPDGHYRIGPKEESQSKTGNR